MPQRHRNLNQWRYEVIQNLLSNPSSQNPIFIHTFYVICINSIDNQPANLLHILSSELESNRKSKPWVNCSSDWKKKGFRRTVKQEKGKRKKERKFNLVSRVYSVFKMAVWSEFAGPFFLTLILIVFFHGWSKTSTGNLKRFESLIANITFLPALASCWSQFQTLLLYLSILYYK